ncbi:Wzx-like protein [Methanobrevibacter arboriphilus JCM 13429 = DSM 1125]|uniref:Wzx-like protein n=1 Tax=Methanobrevibacter arboriphilus JCM 13429 = DSM 1125 TaxID=1300164 RepID=A0A1V6N3J7_METAZ|nr:flippase [Methanobrevibacter arboriphilus]OQD59245.1 Wzx-like protein [Methanobrevibacter arboriphilus JCM 13429 = DSM 1125]
MSKINEIFKNTSWLLISQVITSIFGFVWIVLLARYLGVSDFGIMNFAISFTGIMSIFIDLGINTYVTRDLSRSPELSQKYIGNAIPLKIFLSILSFIATLVILLIMDYNLLTIEVVLLFAIQTIFLNMGWLFNGVFQAFSKMKYQAIGIIINSSLILSGTLLLTYFNLGLIAVALSYMVGSIITLIYLYNNIKNRIVVPKIQIDLDFWKKSIKQAIPFGITGIFTTIYFMIDTVMISFMAGSTAVGIYSSAYKIITVFTTIYTVYTYVVFPLMSKLYKDSEDLLKVSYEKSIKYLLMIMLPFAIGITIYSQDIITFIYGESYIFAGDVLKILIWNVLFIMINGASTSLLNSSNSEVAVTKINGLACLVNVVLNLFLIYYLSYIGASIATVITGVIIFILMTYIILKNKYKPDKSLIYGIVKICVSGIILAIILLILNLSMWIALPVAIIVYLIGIYLTKSLDSTDKAVIKEIIGK